MSNEASAVPPSTVQPSFVTDAAGSAAEVDIQPTTIGRYRWVICGLLFFASTINYIDRQVMGILSKDLQLAFGWSEIDYGNIVAAFNAAYARPCVRLLLWLGNRADF